MIHFITGGAGSGKSAYAESLVKDLGQVSKKTVFYIATSVNNDQEMLEKVEKHRQRRPDHWQLIEEPYFLADQLEKINDSGHIVLIDCMTLYLTNWLFGKAADHWQQEKQAFLQVAQKYSGNMFVVSNEIGSGVIPMGKGNREFVATAGELNQSIAAIANKATLVVAGLPLPLKA